MLSSRTEWYSTVLLSSVFPFLIHQRKKQLTKIFSLQAYLIIPFFNIIVLWYYKSMYFKCCQKKSQADFVLEMFYHLLFPLSHCRQVFHFCPVYKHEACHCVIEEQGSVSRTQPTGSQMHLSNPLTTNSPLNLCECISHSVGLWGDSDSVKQYYEQGLQTLSSHYLKGRIPLHIKF